MLSKKLKITLIGTSLLVGTSLIAAPHLKQVKAFLNPTITYTLDGNMILKGTNTLNYNDKNYISVAELAKALGFEVNYKNNVVNFITPNKEDPMIEPSDTKNVIIPKATIKGIDLNSKQVTILPEGMADEARYYIVLNVDDTTTIKHLHNKAIYTLSDLSEGMSISVTHSIAMTRSLPPQTAALAITLLEDTVVAAPESITLENMVVVEINHKENYFIVVPQGKDTKDITHQTIIRYDQKTKLNFNDSKKQPNVNSLKVGALVTLRISPAMTMSIPPQTFALEIQVH